MGPSFKYQTSTLLVLLHSYSRHFLNLSATFGIIYVEEERSRLIRILKSPVYVQHLRWKRPVSGVETGFGI